jgi:hypothetical protein
MIHPDKLTAAFAVLADGATFKQAAAQVGCCPESLAKYTRRLRPELARPRGKPPARAYDRGIPPEAIIALARNGKTLNAIAAETGWPLTRVCGMVRKLAPELIRRRGRPRLKQGA